MRKVFLLFGIYFMIFASGCGTTKILTDYKDNYTYKFEKISPVETYKAVETKRPNIFPLAKKSTTSDYFVSTLLIAPVFDLFLCTPYELLFGKRIIKYKANVLLTGQILDENNTPVGSKKIIISFDDTCFDSTTDENGFFEENLEIKEYSKIKDTITLYFNTLRYPDTYDTNIEHFKNDITKKIISGETVTITEPFAVKYTIDNTDNSITREDFYITNISNNGTVQIISKETNSLSDVIHIKSYEYFKNTRTKKGASNAF